MTAAAIPIGLVPQRSAWRSLLWIGPLTAVWILLIYWQPIITGSGFPTTAHQLTAHGLLALGLWLGLERTDLTPGQRRATWLAVMIPDTLWFALAWSAAISGTFHPDVAAVPLLPFAIFVPIIIGAPVLLLSKRVGQVLDAMPASWLIALQLYRVFGIWAVMAGLRGALPELQGFPAGIGDLLTGLFAVPAAIAVATGTAQGRRAAILWNVFGLIDFADAITLGIIFASVSSIGAGVYPDVLTPAFVVPSSTLLHLLSLRQLRRRGQAEAARQ